MGRHGSSAGRGNRVSVDPVRCRSGVQIATSGGNRSAARARTNQPGRVKRAVHSCTWFSPPARSQASTCSATQFWRKLPWFARICCSSTLSAIAYAEHGRRRHTRKPASNTPSTRAISTVGDKAECALMNSKTRTGSPRPRPRTGRPRETRCRAPTATAYSRAKTRQATSPHIKLAHVYPGLPAES